jgi:hypothetical protein
MVATVFGVVVLIVAVGALLYQKKEIVPMQKTTTVKPWVVFALFGAALLCFYSGCGSSDSGEQSAKEGQSKAVQPVQNRPAFDWSSRRDKN